MSSVHKWIYLGSHCWAAVLHPAVVINCRKNWWPTNPMNHPWARVPPLLFALGICCPWGVFLSIWLCLHLCLGLEQQSSLEVHPMVISTWPELVGAAEQFWSMLVEHWPRGRANVLPPEQGSGHLTQQWLSGIASSQKTWASLVQVTQGTRLSLGWSKHLNTVYCSCGDLSLWGPEFGSAPVFPFMLCDLLM